MEAFYFLHAWGFPRVFVAAAVGVVALLDNNEPKDESEGVVQLRSQAYRVGKLQESPPVVSRDDVE